MKNHLSLFVFVLTCSFALLSCGADDGEVAVIENPFDELDKFEVYRALPDGAVLNQNGRAPLSAIIDGDFTDFHSGRVYGGTLFYEIRLRGERDVTLRMRQFKPGIFAVSNVSGFTQAFVDGIACSVGEIRLIDVDQANKKISGNFTFTALDEQGNAIRVSAGQFSDVSFGELTPVQGTFILSAEVNGKPWAATVYDCFKGAATFGVSGYNKVGNVALNFSSFYWAEQGGPFDLNAGDLGIGLRIGKDELQPLGGNINLDRNDSDVFEGRFEVVYKDYELRKGRFSFIFR